ncbi:MAG: toll/interleukin-1 receptor domain-containing protein [Hyphomonadaceae bacterium]|nr:toll/interleukin-1 receptor domain-containing protein [Hyphomonadaceae bacterium]
MFVFIAHAEADQTAADDLKAFLKSRGLVVETETGAKGFRHLQPSDVVVALWSQKSVFAAHRMQIERRMLEAWEDERLVLVKLDHAFLPVGLRDLPAVDASFETGRQLSVWPQVERAAREAMNRALVSRQSQSGAQSSGSGAPPALGEKILPAPSVADRPSPGGFNGGVSRERTAPAPAAAKRGSILPTLFLIIAAGALGWAGWEVFLRPESTLLLTNLAYGVAGLGVILLLWIFAQALRPAPKPKGAAKRAEAAAPPPPAAAPAPQPLATAVFISYAHADSGAVEPVVKIVEQSGREVWIDKGGIQAGEGWAGEIVRAIKGAKSVVVMCSSHAFESDHIKREVYLADRYKKPMFPVFLEAAKMPEDFEYFFAGVQWLELFRLSEADRPGAITKALATA